MEQLETQTQRAAFLAVGQPVVTIDGRAIGTIEEVGHTHFKVHRRLHRSFWLPRADVFLSDTKGVVVSFPASDVSARRLSRPVSVLPDPAQVEVTA